VGSITRVSVLKSDHSPSQLKFNRLLNCNEVHAVFVGVGEFVV